MALDTFAKRLSAMHLTCPWRLSLPIPDGTPWSNATVSRCSTSGPCVGGQWRG